MQMTSIGWTDFSANPLKYRRKSDGKVVWGCVKTSPGCAHCYSEAIALRFDRGRVFNARNMEELEPFLDEAELSKMLTAQRVGGVAVADKRCFVGDMTDMFGEWVPDVLLDCLFAVMGLRNDVTWQVLTKRAERIQKYFSYSEREAAIADTAKIMYSEDHYVPRTFPWPLPNVWLGVSVENQEQADARIPCLLRCPAAVRFISAEPLLGPVELRHGLCFHSSDDPNQLDHSECAPTLDWCITGCESGKGRREFRLEWDLALERACRLTGVSFFRKQIVLDGKVSTNPEEWPDDLRVQQMPV